MTRMRVTPPPSIHGSGLLAALPADGAWPDGSTFFATDQNGGTVYRMVSGVWTQAAPGVDEAVGVIAGPVQMTGGTSFDVKAVGTTVTDVTGMSINVPASSRPVLLRAKWEVQANSGTAANASNLSVFSYITDSANTIIASGGCTFVQVSTSAIIFRGQIALEKYLPAPVSAATYKLRASTTAVPANWSSALLFPANGNGTTGSEDNFYAIAL